MAGRDFLRQYRAVNSAPMTGNISSPVINIQGLDNIGVQLNFTGTPVGTFQILVSADHAEDDVTRKVTNPGTFIPITLPSTPIAAGVAGQIFIDLNQLASAFMRIDYTFTSGTGTLDAYVTGKKV